MPRLLEKSADLVRYLGNPLGEIFPTLRMVNITMQGDSTLYKCLMEDVREDK